MQFSSLFPLRFPLNLEGLKKKGPRGKTFFPIFCLSYFLSSTKQWITTFFTLFFFPYFPPFLFSPQPNTRLVVEAARQSE